MAAEGSHTSQQQEANHSIQSDGEGGAIREREREIDTEGKIDKETERLCVVCILLYELELKPMCL